MTVPPPSPLAQDLTAALDWWRVAGVDVVFADAPKAWLAEPEQASSDPPTKASKPAAEVAAPEPKLGGPRENWPRDIAAFAPWWLTDPSLDSGGLSPPVAPRGSAGADLMVIVEMPEETDRERLLSGRHGALIDGFLVAAEIAADRVYVASALRRHAPLPDWSEMARHGLGEVLQHHIGLVAPKRVLLLGRNILPLWGHDPAQGAQNLHSLDHEGGRVPVMADAGLDRLLEKPALRAKLWRRWLDWTGERTREDGG